MRKRQLLILVICASFILLLTGVQNLVAEYIAYTIIFSESTENAAMNLQKSLSNMLGPDVPFQKINYKSPEAKELINQLNIKFIPYVIFNNTIKKHDKFSDMVQKERVVKKDDTYVIPDKMLMMLGIMFLDRPSKKGQLDLFMMSQCPAGNDALSQIDTFLTANPEAFNVDIHYLTEIGEFGISSKRGQEEVKESVRRLLIKKYHPDKFWQYHRSINLQKKDPIAVGEELEIDPSIAESKKEEGIALLKDDFNFYNELNIAYSTNSSPTFLWENNLLFANLKQFSDYIMPGSFVVSEELKVAEGVLPISVFYGPRCPHCRKLLEMQIPKLEKEFGGAVSFIYYNIQVPHYAEKKREMEERYNVKKIGHIPQVYIDGQVLVGRKQINSKLKQIIKKYLDNKKKRADKQSELVASAKSDSYTEKISRRFRSFTPIAIIISGFLDGINPCAFSTIVFFMSFLVFAKFSVRRMAVVGAFFILAVFLTYLGLGLGLFVWLEKIRAFVLISEYFDAAIGGITILLGVASLYDYFVYRRKKTSEGILLKLPAVVKNAIHSSIGKLRDKNTAGMIKLLFFAFGLGVLVSLLESVCTGQIYVPTLSFMIKMNMVRVKAFLYLLLYNLMFILPLVAVFLTTLFCGTSQWWTNFVKKNVGRIKLLTALFFFAIGALIIFI